MTDFRLASRSQTVEEIRLDHSLPGHPLHPKDQPECWKVFLALKDGTKLPTHHYLIFFSEYDANAFVERHQPGTHYDSRQEFKPTEEMFDAGFIGRIGDRGDCDTPLAFNILHEAGITTWDGITPAVSETLGEARVKRLKDLHKENWAVAAAFEFCWSHLPHSSAAYLAAAYQYNWYILNDDFAAGYIWRDLEIVTQGIEGAARRSDKLLTAARQGGRARAENSRSNAQQLLAEMRQLVARGQSASSAARICFNRGLGKSAEANRKAWVRHKAETKPC